MTLTGIKNYLRVDDDCTDDDQLIAALMAAAIKFMQEQTGKLYVNGDGLQDLCMAMLVAHWYENRGIVASNNREVPLGADAMLKHIALGLNYAEV